VSPEDRNHPQHGRRDASDESAARIRIALAWIACAEAWLEGGPESAEIDDVDALKALEALKLATASLERTFGEGFRGSEGLGPKDAQGSTEVKFPHPLQEDYWFEEAFMRDLRGR